MFSNCNIGIIINKKLVTIATILTYCHYISGEEYTNIDM